MSLSLCRASVLWFICRVPIAQNTIRICPNIASSGTPLHRGKSQPFSYPLSSLLYDTFLKFPLSSSPPSFHTYFFSIFLFFFTNPYFLVFSSLTLSLIFFRYIRYIFYPFSPIRPQKKTVLCILPSLKFWVSIKLYSRSFLFFRSSYWAHISRWMTIIDNSPIMPKPFNFHFPHRLSFLLKSNHLLIFFIVLTSLNSSSNYPIMCIITITPFHNLKKRINISQNIIYFFY